MNKTSLLTLILLLTVCVQPVYAQTSNFNPSNNVVKNGDFSKPELKVVNQGPVPSYGEWCLGIFNQNVTYYFTTIDGKTCLVVDTRNAASSAVFLAQMLYNTRVNATTRVHFSIKFLSAEHTEKAVQVMFGTFQKTPPDTESGRTNLEEGFMFGLHYFIFAGEDRNWRTADDNLVEEVLFYCGRNITGWYFSCPGGQDVSLSIPTEVVVAVTDVAVYDSEEPEKPVAPLFSLTVDCGSPVQAGEEATFYVLSTVNGTPADVDSLTLTLVKPDFSTVPVQPVRLSIGLYYASFHVDAAGTYTLLVYGEKAGAKASALKCVKTEGLTQQLNELKELLKNTNATITQLILDVEGNIIAKIDAGNMKVNAKLDALNATVVDVKDDIAVIKTAVGDLSVKVDELKKLIEGSNASITQLIVDSEGRITAEIEAGKAKVNARLDALNASIEAVHEGVVAVNTAIGELKASLSALNANITQLIIESENRTIVQMRTLIGPLNVTLEQVNGKVTEIHNNIATVLIPGLGEVKALIIDAKASSQAAFSQLYILIWITLAVSTASLILHVSGAVKKWKMEKQKEKQKESEVEKEAQVKPEGSSRGYA